MWQVLKWNRKWDNACRLNKCCITSSPSYHAIWNLKILVRFELFISTERSLMTIRQLTNFRLYELTNVCEGVTGDQAESVRKHFATPAGFLHRRWLCNTPESRTVKKKKTCSDTLGRLVEILKDVRLNILITVGPKGRLGLRDRNKWPLSRGRRCSQCMDVLSAGRKKVAVVERWPLRSTALFSLWLLRNRVTRNGYKKRGRRSRCVG